MSSRKRRRDWSRARPAHTPEELALTQELLGALAGLQSRKLIERDYGHVPSRLSHSRRAFRLSLAHLTRAVDELRYVGTFMLRRKCIGGTCDRRTCASCRSWLVFLELQDALDAFEKEVASLETMRIGDEALRSA